MLTHADLKNPGRGNQASFGKVSEIRLGDMGTCRKHMGTYVFDIYIYMYMYIYTYIYMYAYVYIHIYIYILGQSYMGTLILTSLVV